MKDRNNPGQLVEPLPPSVTPAQERAKLKLARLQSSFNLRTWASPTIVTVATPPIDLTDEELAAVVASVRRTLDEDRYPLAPRLKPLRSALAKLDPASAPKSPPAPKPPLPEAPARGRGGRRTRR